MSAASSPDKPCIETKDIYGPQPADWELIPIDILPESPGEAREDVECMTDVQAQNDIVAEVDYSYQGDTDYRCIEYDDFHDWCVDYGWWHDRAVFKAEGYHSAPVDAMGFLDGYASSDNCRIPIQGGECYTYAYDYIYNSGTNQECSTARAVTETLGAGGIYGLGGSDSDSETVCWA